MTCRTCGLLPSPESTGACCWDAAHFRSGLRVVVVGERLNVGSLTAKRADFWARRWRDLLVLDPERLLSNLLRLGAFNHGASRTKLLATGLRWDGALNLLPPAAIGTWEPALARQVAASIRPVLAARADRVVLLGRRVAGAFATATSKRGGHDFVELPHPSGRSRLWNDPATLRSCRAQVWRMLSGGHE